MRARQITANIYLLLKDDIEEGNLNHPEMIAKLLCSLETAMHRAMQETNILQLQVMPKFL